MNVDLYWSRDEAKGAGAWVFVKSTGSTVHRRVFKGIPEHDTEGAKAAAIRAETERYLADPLAALQASIEKIKQEHQ